MEIKTVVGETIELSADGMHMVIYEDEQRQFIVWMKNNRPDILRDIMCDDCMENDHITPTSRYHP